MRVDGVDAQPWSVANQPYDSSQLALHYPHPPHTAVELQVDGDVAVACHAAHGGERLGSRDARGNPSIERPLDGAIIHWSEDEKRVRDAALAQGERLFQQR